ncbi:MAG: MFS transporter [Porticoccaceae bacterium]|jgi:MFS family permease|nr:MFS transporter [Porticoccaceae bacterium]
MEQSNQPKSQFHLFTQRRFLPFFVTQFLGALNDNLFKNALLVIVVSSAIAGSEASTNFTTNFAVGLFILPFFLFSTTAGQLADTYDKAMLMRRVKLAEILIMLAGSYALMTQNLNFMLLILFLLGTQSAFFGPAKYSLIPQHLNSDELLAGNAQISMGTFGSILLGTLIGGWMVTLENGITLLSGGIVLVSIIGWLCSREIPEAPSENTRQKLSLNPFAETAGNFRMARENRTVFHCILAISWFWLYGGCFLTQVPNFTVTVLNGHPRLISILLGAFIIGVALGSLLCNRLSRGVIEPGIVPLGAIGLSIFAFDLSFASIAYQEAHGSLSAVMPMRFLGLDGGPHILIDLVLIGMFGGFFIVPLNSMVQQRTAANNRARVLSVNAIMNSAYMVGGSLLGIFFLSILGWSIVSFFITVAVMNILVVGIIFVREPEFFSRFKLWSSSRFKLLSNR